MPVKEDGFRAPWELSSRWRICGHGIVLFMLFWRHICFEPGRSRPRSKYQWCSALGLHASSRGLARFVLDFASQRAQKAMKQAAWGLLLILVSVPAAAVALSPPSNLRILASGALAIVTGPQNQAVVAGSDATFSVAATGDGPLSYQWTFNGTNVGANSSTYNRGMCQQSDDDGRVQVKVSNPAGSLASSIATLTVNPNVPAYYVSPSGSTLNNGLSPAAAWPLTYALSRIGPSNILTFLPGTYPSFGVSRSGTILRSQVKWGAKVIGTPGNHGIWTTGDNVVSNVLVEGFEVSHSYIDGVKLNGPNSTVRNCWIHHSGRGNPLWVTNTDASFSGQGVASHAYPGTVIEYNLIEENGAWLNHDHGIYISGTNCVVRGNVLRKNLAYGIQLYDTSPSDCMDARVCRNLVYGNGRGAFIVYSWGGFTNYLFNNTIIASVNGPIQTEYGVLCMSNNVIVSTSSSWIVEEDAGPPLQRDYNVISGGRDSSPGPHDINVSDPGFVNSSAGLYWLTAASRARGAATANITPDRDFFGNWLSAVTDAGAFQYSPNLESDSRVLEPSPANPNYWAAGP